MDYAYTFPVVRGVQAQRTYYIAMIPLRMLRRLFGGANEYVPPEYRAQRRLNESRIPIIRNYILENRDTYVFSALAASIDGAMEYAASGSEDLGVLSVSIDASFLINDGQHRMAALLEAIVEDESLLNETIPVVFFEDQGLDRSQQMFTDLNKHAVRTSNSIAELYDSRDELAVATRKAVRSVPFLDRYTDKERDNLGKYSSALFTLNMFYKANKRIIGRDRADEERTQFLLHYWKTISAHMVPWIEVNRGEARKIDIREQSISAQAVLIQAFGRIGHAMVDMTQEQMEGLLEKLETIDWARSNPLWLGRTIDNNGRIMSNDNAITLTANAIKKHVGIELSADEKKREDALRSALDMERDK